MSDDSPVKADEVLTRTIGMTDAEWKTRIWERCQGQCSNCGGEDRLEVRQVVPSEAGGFQVESNGVLLCRTCEMASESYSRATDATSRRLINFWVSRPLYKRIQEGLNNTNRFSSMSALVRYLISKYVANEDRFDDLEQYQDSGVDVKINVWVGKDQYATFRSLLDKRGLKVTSAVKSLIRMYEDEAEAAINRGSN